MSFIVVSSTIEYVYKFISYIVTTIWNSILSIINGLINLFGKILSGSVDAILNLPPDVLKIGGIFIIIILCVEKLRNSVGDFLSLLWEEIKELLTIIKEVFKELWQIITELFEALQPFLKDTLIFYSYFIEQSNLAIQELEKLENSRAR